MSRPSRPRLLRARLAAVLLVLPSTAAAGAANEITSAHGAVASEHRLASLAGVEILAAGGNAVDAAVAASLATGVVNPSSSGLGGGGFMTIYLAAATRAHVLDYRETAPAAAHRTMYVHAGKADAEASRTGGLAVAVPGEPAGLALALERFGSFDMARVAAPAIRLAREGFEVAPHLAKMLESSRAKLAADPALAAVFLDARGNPYAAGQTLRRPDLARTLELLAAEGGEAFYSGPLAAEIVAAARARGGILTADDLATYRPVERSPLLLDYAGARIVAMPPPSSGGGTLAAALAVLDGYALRDLGHNSTTYIHLLAETLKAVFADRATHYGDPDFVAVPLDRLLSPAHALGIRKRLSATRPVPAEQYGSVLPVADAGTSHISVIDAAGNAVACTTSVNTGFGSLVGVPGRDIVLNNTMDDFSIQPGVANAFGLVGSEANSVTARKRPLSSMSPTIVLAGGRARLVAGASGGPLIISATLQVLLNVLEFGMSATDAVAAARIHHQWLPDVVGVEPAVAEDVRVALGRMGHSVRVFPAQAAVQVVESVEIDGARRLRAVSDPRKGGIPAGY